MNMPNLPIVPPSAQSLLLDLLRLPADNPGESVGDVEPHDAGVGMKVDPRAAWQSAVWLMTGTGRPHAMPSGWANLIWQQTPLSAVPLAFAHFPQQMRELPTATELSASTRTAAIELPPALRDWVVRRGTDAIDQLMAAGVYRAAGDCARAESAIRRAVPTTADETTLHASELAATLWMKGERETARDLWLGLSETPAVCFNRGMSCLFTGRRSEAATHLTKALSMLSEDNAWHHLAGVYLALSGIDE